MNQTYENKLNIVQKIEREKFTAEIVEFKDLKGVTSTKNAKDLFYIKEAGMTLKQIRITLNKGEFLVNEDAFYYMKGQIEAEFQEVGMGIKKMAQEILNSEIYKTTYRGTGELVLTPSYDNYILMELENETIIVDNGLYYASESTLKIDVAGVLEANAGFQTKISGTGLVILQVPVPKEEILICNLENEKLQVSCYGKIALLRTENIKYTLQKPWQVFEGTGKVWLAPTKRIRN